MLIFFFIIIFLCGLILYGQVRVSTYRNDQHLYGYYFSVLGYYRFPDLRLKWVIKCGYIFLQAFKNRPS